MRRTHSCSTIQCTADAVRVTDVVPANGHTYITSVHAKENPIILMRWKANDDLWICSLYIRSPILSICAHIWANNVCNPRMGPNTERYEIRNNTKNQLKWKANRCSFLMLLSRTRGDVTCKKANENRILPVRCMLMRVVLCKCAYCAQKQCTVDAKVFVC